MASEGSIVGKSATWDERIEALDAKLSNHAVLRSVALKFGVRPYVVTVGVAVWVLSFVVWGFTGDLICTVVAYMYPAYASFKAVEAGSSECITHWLRFWLTYAVCSLVESVLYKMLAWIPFYHIFRLVFIVWLFLPRFDGAQILYNWVVRPILRKYQPSLDASLGQLATSFGTAADVSLGHCASRCAEEVQKAAATRIFQAAGAAVNAKVHAGTPPSPGERRENLSGARARTASPAPVAIVSAVCEQAGVDIKAD